MSSKSAQSSIEFLSSYSFVLVIIGAVLVMLFILTGISKSAIPNNCTSYGGFNCADSAYAINVTAQRGSLLYLIFLDEQPGIVNITRFTATLDYANSTAGSCSPATVQNGNYFVCSANFTLKPTLGNTYSGHFLIRANYCSPSLTNLHTMFCAPSSAYNYSGTISVSATDTIPKFTTTTIATTTIP